ncbi:hypothetical protein AMR41_27740 [Hapalosiphon sp. MRB220]|nr:hypothetical protein AMR41_27740 [Hapalosiphon sp. MRB220]
MTTRLYKIEYVELNPVEAEESEDGLEILEIIAEVDGDVDDAITFWAKDMDWTIVNYSELIPKEEPKIYMASTNYLEL